MTDQELLDLLHQGLHQVTNRTFEPLTANDPLQELGVDSLELLELVTWVEQRTGHRVPDATVFTAATVGELCATLRPAPSGTAAR